MEIFRDIDFKFDSDKFYRRINLDKYMSLKGDVDDLLDKAIPLIKPKAVYKVSFIEKKTDDSIDIGEAIFESKTMVKNLKDVHRIFPYIATCGNELEDLEQGLEDVLERFWLDVLKEMALQDAILFINRYIKDKYAMKKMASMNPGSADIDVWPIEQQERLFSIFGDVESLIGVKLTQSCLMIPNKSISGFYFPTTVSFQNCQLCTRKSCPDRRVPYKG
ncbi:MAG: vitamin B12 dependent-methionine synthase activation domain-containing protein [Clostridia bacterium]|nr:vitamin B12 dependent-methionine synthase activation domain-containing protein [Clostridia bacterium]